MHGREQLINQQKEATMIVGVIIFIVCLVNLSSGSPRYANIKVKLEPASLKSKGDVCGKTDVEISVSSELDESTSRRLLVSWWTEGVESADMIALYITDPAVNLTSPVYTLVPTSNTGWSHTPLRELYLDYIHIFSPVCLGFWAVYWRGHTKLASSCLQTNPRWMSDYSEFVGKLRLTELFIPGTHDSAAYSVSFQPREQTRYEKYVFTQDESVLSQLINGVRYLDLRPGYHKSDGGFYAHHGVAKLRHFQGVIDDIVVFLNNSRDIVIMDLHHFPVGFKTEEVHQEFMKYLEKELSPYMATPALGWQATLNDVWKTGKLLIVSYNNKALVGKRTHKLWYPVIQQWGDVKTVQALKDYLGSTLKRHVLLPRAAMAELTPDRWDVLLDSKGGLRTMAANTNHLVTDWFRGDWGLHCNIVAVDFIRSSGIVDTAVRWNLMKAINLCQG